MTHTRYVISKDQESADGVPSVSLFSFENYTEALTAKNLAEMMFEREELAWPGYHIFKIEHNVKITKM